MSICFLVHSLATIASFYAANIQQTYLQREVDTAGEVGQDRDRRERDQHCSNHMTGDPPRDHQEKGVGTVHYLLQTEGHTAEEITFRVLFLLLNHHNTHSQAQMASAAI